MDIPISLPTLPEASKQETCQTRKYSLPTARNPAKGGASLLVNVPYLDTAVEAPTLQKPVAVSIYKTGAVVHWSLSSKKARRTPESSIRGQIKDMSPKARRRAAFALGNAPLDWWLMITLTFLSQPKNPKKVFDKFTRKLRLNFDMSGQWAWIMEYQTRGVIHYHIFLGADFDSRNRINRSANYETVIRNDRETSILRGPFDDFIVREWIAAVGDTSAPFARFQKGGIVEVFRSPDAAARYVAKEAGKRHQKELPKGIKGGNRWFWASPACKAKQTHGAKLTTWPFDIVVGTVFDKMQLEPFLSDIRKV